MVQPYGQQQILDVIERDLCVTDPQLVMSFSALIPDRRRAPGGLPQGRLYRLGRWTGLALVLATMACGLLTILLAG